MNKLFILLTLFVHHAHADQFPSAVDPWLRAAPPNAKMLAAYVTLDNQTEENLKLTGAYAPDFKMAEIHKTVEVDGVLSMQEQPTLSLPIGQTITMKPGGLHIMLMMPTRSFKEGEQVRICLVYTDQDGKESVQHLDFPVKRQ